MTTGAMEEGKSKASGLASWLKPGFKSCLCTMISESLPLSLFPTLQHEAMTLLSGAPSDLGELVRALIPRPRPHP